MSNSLKLIFVFVLSIIVASCNDVEDLKKTSSASEIWFKQANVDLGSKIIMKSIDEGIAISRGAGYVKKGKLYSFNNGKWQSVFEFDYSDNPQLIYTDEKVWFIHHETHHNFWKPRFYEFDGENTEEIILPQVMWDETDYSMWNGIEILSDGTAWMIGQLGNMLYFDGENWKEYNGPLKNIDKKSVYSGDLNDIEFVNDNLGWAVGREGIIIKYENGNWTRMDSPVELELGKISLVDENNGWIVGDRGTILELQNGIWQIFNSKLRTSFTSVKAATKDKAWIVGARSTLLEWDGVDWNEIESIKSFDDVFVDISFAVDSNGNYKLWVMGQAGIYTTSQNMGFSFTDITDAASLRSEGKAATFLDDNKDGLLDIALLADGGPNLFFMNNGNNVFSEVSRDFGESAQSAFDQLMVLGDLDADNDNDLLEVLDDLNYKLLFGSGNFSFKADSERGQLDMDMIDSAFPQTTAKFIDFDNDGDLDIYVANFNRADMLFENEGYGNFIDVFNVSGIEKKLNRQAYGAVFNDFNNDMLVDVLIVYRFSEENRFLELYLNNGDLTFEEKINSAFSSKIAIAPYSAISNDFNNDGTQDLLVFNNTKTPSLFINDGKANFTDVSDETGLPEFGQHPDPSGGILNSADVNNDGYLDVFISSQFFLNSAGLKFNEVSEQVGLNFSGNPSFGDIDNDGDQDLFIGIRKNSAGLGESAKLFRNNLDQANSVKVRLNSDQSNSNGIGTRILLLGRDESGTTVYKTVRYLGLGEAPISQQNITELHFGLKQKLNYSLEVTFPSGNANIIENVQAGKIYKVSESLFPLHSFILLKSSILRSINLMNWEIELIKFIIFLVLIALIYSVSKKMKSVKYFSKIYFIPLLILFYLIAVHTTIKTNIFAEWLVPLLVPSFLTGVFLFYSNKIIEERESKYISHYKLLDILGMGGMGKVFKAVDTQNNKIVALKILNPTLLKDEENRKRLNSEGRLLSSIEHKNIVKVFEFGETEKHSYIAMEYLTGGTLEELIEADFPLDQNRFKEIVLGICEGLITIHQSNVLHRDLKSQNIMLDDEGKVRIMDFGLSKSPLVSTMTSLGTVVGTLGYVAPEQVTNIEVDQRTDIFSFGVILYQMLTNKLPFTGENEMALIHSIFNTFPQKPSEIDNSVSEAFDKIIMKCIEKDPEKRYNSVTEIKEDFLKL